MSAIPSDIRAERLMRSATVVLDSGLSAQSPGAIATRRFANHFDVAQVREMIEAITRGTQNPAMTSAPEWAGSLVQESVAGLVELLAASGNVVAQLPLQRYDFAKRGRIIVPRRKSGATVNLAGAFRAEGSPIRVGSLQLVGMPLQAKSMAVTATASAEMIEGAGDDVMANVIKNGAIADTSAVLDNLFLDATPANSIRPAGLGALAESTPASGTDAAAIVADLRGMLDRLVAAGYGSAGTTRWIMSTLNLATLSTISDEVRLNGKYLGVPIASGLKVPEDAVYLLDGDAVALAMDAPKFDSASDTLLHEEDDADAVATIDAGKPVRSIWQTFCLAFRLVWPIDWNAPDDGCIQALTGVAWVPGE